MARGIDDRGQGIVEVTSFEGICSAFSVTGFLVAQGFRKKSEVDPVLRRLPPFQKALASTGVGLLLTIISSSSFRLLGLNKDYIACYSTGGYIAFTINLLAIAFRGKNVTNSN